MIGPNGAGKTTLFNIISGVYAPTSGKIYLNDEDITGLPPFKICCKGIARTYQNINLFHSLTVMENVKIGCHTKVRSNLFSNIVHTSAQKAEERAIQEKCMELLEFVGLADKVDYLARNLSYGDQRRLEIARAMATEPHLLLDEPAAGMNSKEKVDLTELISKINSKGMTILLVEHDTIITSGIMVDESLKAYEALQAEGISVRVIDMFTWKPLDEELVIKAAKETGAIVTAENHNVTCGLGSVVANCLAKNAPTVQEFVGVQDLFGQVGPQDFLMDEYGLRAANIVAAVKKAVARK